MFGVSVTVLLQCECCQGQAGALVKLFAVAWCAWVLQLDMHLLIHVLIHSVLRSWLQLATYSHHVLCLHLKQVMDCMWEHSSWYAGRLESFFGAVTTKHSTTGKRKEPESKSKPAAKKGKMGGVGKKK